MAEPVYQVNAALSAIAQKYANDQTAYIADRLFPKVPVSKRLYEYRKYDTNQQYSAPNDYVGQKSQVHEIKELKSTLVPAKVKDYGLAIALGQDDIQNNVGENNTDPKSDNVKFLVSQVLLKKEVRAMTLAFLASAYSGTDTNGGTSDYGAALTADNADFVGDVLTILDATKTRRFNKAAMSLKTFNRLRLNIGFLPDGGGSDRVADRAAIARILELDEILVSSAVYDSAAAGLTASVADLVNDSILFFRQDMGRTSADGYQNTFAIQPTLRDMHVWEYFDPDMGLDGGQRIKCGQTNDLVVLDRTESYLLTNLY